MITWAGRTLTIRHTGIAANTKVSTDYTIDVLNVLYWLHVRNDGQLLTPQVMDRALEIMERTSSYPQGSMLDVEGNLKSWVVRNLSEVRDTYHEIANTDQPIALLPVNRLEHVAVKAEIDIVAVQLAGYLATSNETPPEKAEALAERFPQILKDQFTPTTSEASGFGQVSLDDLRRARLIKYFDQLHRYGMVTLREFVWRVGKPGRKPSFVTLTPYATMLVDET